MIKHVLLMSLTLSGCSNAIPSTSETPNFHKQEEEARSAYLNCLKGKAAELQSTEISPDVVAEVALARCAAARDVFTAAWIEELAEADYPNCGENVAKTACTMRDSFERRFLKSIRDDVARTRGVPVEKELDY